MTTCHAAPRVFSRVWLALSAWAVEILPPEQEALRDAPGLPAQGRRVPLLRAPPVVARQWNRPALCRARRKVSSVCWPVLRPAFSHSYVGCCNNRQETDRQLTQLATASDNSFPFSLVGPARQSGPGALRGAIFPR